VASLLPRIPFRSLLKSSQLHPLFDWLNGTSTDTRGFIRSDDDDNPTLRIQNLGDGGALELLDPSGDAYFSTYVLGLAINGQIFSVLNDGAVGDGTTDDTAAVQATIDRALAAKGGIVYFPPSASGAGYRLNGRITITGHGVVLAGPSMAKATEAASTRIIVGHKQWPAILFGASATETSMVGIRDLTFAPSSAVVGGDVSTYEGDASYGALIGLDRADRVYLHRVWVQDCQDFVASGTANNPRGCSKVEIRDCEVYFFRYGMAIRSAPYFDVADCHWQDTSPGAGTAFRFFGGGDGSSLLCDGGRISNVFVESVGTGIRCEQTGGAVNNVQVQGLFLDGVRVACFWGSNSGGSIAKVAVTGGIWNCFDEGTGYGILLEQSATGYQRSLKFDSIQINDAGRHAVWITAPTAVDRKRDLDFMNLSINNCGGETDNTYSGFLLGNDLTAYRIMGCSISSHLPDHNKQLAYGINQGTGNDHFVIAGNAVRNAQTARYSVGTAHDGVTKFWSNPDQPRGYASATGSTSGPTTASASYATQAEMTVTISTIGGDIEASYDGQLKNSDLAANTFVAFSLDGAAEVHERAWNQQVADQYAVVSMAHRFTAVAAGSHTVTVRWKVSAGTATANGTRRDLIVEEKR
jgi:hypothetical protein